MPWRREEAKNEGEHDHQVQYLTFHVAGEEYALGILQVKEIIEYGAVTRVPTTPDFIRGVINLRGSVVPILDLAVKLGLPKTVVTKWSCIVVVELDLGGELTVMGILVDATGQVIELPPASIQKPPPFGTRARVACLRGMGKVDGKFVMILDLDELFGREDLSSVAPSRLAEAGPLDPAGEPADVMMDR
jgi:purine-binding chemotaxis protein CheW